MAARICVRTGKGEIEIALAVELGGGHAVDGGNLAKARCSPNGRAGRDAIEEVADVVAVDEEGGVAAPWDEGIASVDEGRGCVVVEQ